MAQAATNKEKVVRKPIGPRPVYTVLDLSTVKIDEDGNYTGKPTVVMTTRKSDDVIDRIEGATSNIVYVKGMVK